MESSTKPLFYLQSPFNMTTTIDTVRHTERNVDITITYFKIHGRTIVT